MWMTLWLRFRIRRRRVARRGCGRLGMLIVTRRRRGSSRRRESNPRPHDYESDRGVTAADSPGQSLAVLLRANLRIPWWHSHQDHLVLPPPWEAVLANGLHGRVR